MLHAGFTSAMKASLADLKGHRLESYECVFNKFGSYTYGNLSLNLDGLAIDISNEPKAFSFFDGEEDVACFSCASVNQNEPFKPYLKADTKKFTVNKSISQVELLSDRIDVNHGEYQVEFDVALILHFDDEILMFARGIWFAEEIFIAHNDNYEAIFSKESLIESWSNDGDYEVEVTRTRTQL